MAIKMGVSLADLHYLSVPTFLEISEFYFDMESGSKKGQKETFEGPSGLANFVRRY
jgi:hypothetical protein